ALLQAFADQAVIAIRNVRLFDEVQARSRELSESLDQQTATSKVLDVISRSAFDLQAVFETVAESAVKLCGADRAFIWRFDGELLRMIGAYNAPGRKRRRARRAVMTMFRSPSVHVNYWRKSGNTCRKSSIDCCSA